MPDLNEELDVLDTEDFRAFMSSRDAADTTEPEVEAAPAVGEEETPPSEPADEADQTAAESETEEDEEQEEVEETQGAKPPVARKETKLAKRMRELTGEIKGLKSQLAAQAQPADADEEVTEEVVSSPVVVAKPAEEAVAPKLSDFEDNEETGQSAWDQYAVADKAFNKAETAKAIAAALTAQKQALDQEHVAKEAETAKAAAQADWNKAASRFANYNEVVRAEVQISPAMEVVMRMDPEVGTELAMWLGAHPEESKAMATETLAANEKEWPTALSRAGMKLGAIHAKLTPPAKTAGTPKPAVKGAPEPTPKIKTVTSASRPPTQIRGGAAVPKFDTLDEASANDFGKWNKQREKELATSGKR